MIHIDLEESDAEGRETIAHESSGGESSEDEIEEGPNSGDEPALEESPKTGDKPQETLSEDGIRACHRDRSRGERDGGRTRHTDRSRGDRSRGFRGVYVVLVGAASAPTGRWTQYPHHGREDWQKLACGRILAILRLE